VQKRSAHKESRGGRKAALRLSRATGTITEEIVHPAGRPPQMTGPNRVVTVPLIRGGGPVAERDAAALPAARQRVTDGLQSLPWEGLKLSHGDPAIPTQFAAR
ncbi:MAG: nicotinate phosphoribosyltransferase, partial [Acidimicrobiales bacterium]